MNKIMVAFGAMALVMLAMPAIAESDADADGMVDAEPEVQVEAESGAESGDMADAVARATLTTDIEDREPVDSINSVPAGRDSIHFFTEITGQSGRTITHRWMHNGQSYGDVQFEIGGDRWRVWSTKQFTEDLTGEWEVQVVGDNGAVLHTQSFEYQDVPAEPEVNTGEEPSTQTDMTEPSA